jgi:CO/xanthine dehydrogenase FAD-binding subunit
MRPYLPDYQVITPSDLKEALDAMSSLPDPVPLAGGTDLMVYLECGALNPCTLLNLQSVAGLRGAECMGSVSLGALTTFRDVRVDPVLSRVAPMLAAAARAVGVLAIQSRGTWAGNIANASPAADGVPALMAYDAEVELTSRRGLRTVPLAKFYTGYKQTLRVRDELITGIHMRLPETGWREYYRKIGARAYQAVSKTLLAGRILLDGRTVRDLRLVFASVAPHTLRASRTEAVIRGRELTPPLLDEAARVLQDEISPIDDLRSTAAYRRRVSENLLRDFLQPHCC